MTRYPVEQVIKKIAEARSDESNFDWISNPQEKEVAKIVAEGAFDLCEHWIRHYILTEEFEDESTP